MRSRALITFGMLMALKVLALALVKENEENRRGEKRDVSNEEEERHVVYLIARRGLFV